MVELALPNAFCLSLGQAFQVLAIDIDFDVLRQREPSFMHSVFAQLPVPPTRALPTVVECDMRFLGFEVDGVAAIGVVNDEQVRRLGVSRRAVSDHDGVAHLRGQRAQWP